ncbi:MAG TPA: hypothetical protein VLO11_10905 [Luteolibacter sp.]|nr:hypothetical protein [Luteolibacter sp.]
MTTSLRFDPGGRIGCLYTEAIDLRALGRLHVVRATDIRFNPATQQWDVHDHATGQVLFSHASRNECLRWEQTNLQPQPLAEN